MPGLAPISCAIDVSTGFAAGVVGLIPGPAVTAAPALGRDSGAATLAGFLVRTGAGFALGFGAGLAGICIPGIEAIWALAGVARPSAVIAGKSIFMPRLLPYER
jgi:uncharacterized membrane protein YedE/YeeE